MLDRRHLPLAALRAFESAGRHLHLGRAGDELGVTYGAISHQIRNLEEALGVELFDRSRRQISLTDAGKRLLESVSSGFDRILDGASRLNSDSSSGELVVGCTHTAGTSWAINLIMKFLRNYPQIELHIVEVQPRQKDIPREVDVAICYGKPNAEGRRLEILMKPSIFAVSSPAYLHGRERISTPEQLLQAHLINDNQNSWTQWFGAVGVLAPDPVSQTHVFSTSMALTAARSGHGVALCNLLEVQDDLQDGRLVKVLEHSIPESQMFYLLSSNPQQQSQRAGLLVEWILSELSVAP